MLPDDLADELDREAARQGVSVSKLVREGVILRLAYAAARSGDVEALLAELRRLER